MYVYKQIQQKQKKMFRKDFVEISNKPLPGVIVTPTTVKEIVIAFILGGVDTLYNGVVFEFLIDICKEEEEDIKCMNVIHGNIDGRNIHPNIDEHGNVVLIHRKSGIVEIIRCLQDMVTTQQPFALGTVKVYGIAQQEILRCSMFYKKNRRYDIPGVFEDVYNNIFKTYFTYYIETCRKYEYMNNGSTIDFTALEGELHDFKQTHMVYVAQRTIKNVEVKVDEPMYNFLKTKLVYREFVELISVKSVINDIQQTKYALTIEKIKKLNNTGIVRVENKWNAEMPETDATINELYLYYCARDDDMDGIIYGQGGFSGSKPQSGTFSYGIELSEMFTPSSVLSPSSRHSNRRVCILARVVLGQVYVLTESDGTKYSGTRNKPDVYQSMMYKRDGLVRYIVYDAAQIYPSYVLIYITQ